MSEAPPAVIGPLLFLDDVSDGRIHYAALFFAPALSALGPLHVFGRDHAPEALARFDQGLVARIRFTAPLGAAFEYRWQGDTFPVNADLQGDMRLAYASCNGEEHGDLDRPDAERNVMWARLRAEHARAPFALLLHGGDQIYADEVTQGHPLSEGWPDRVPADPARADLKALRHHLREGFCRRYRHLYASPDLAWLSARVPSLMQWDDHDICDGWGSLPRSRTYSPVGQTLFDAAREACLLFQHAATDADLPPRFGDPGGDHLGWALRLPGLHLVAPDLRSQRSRRTVMGETGWAFLDRELARTGDEPLFVMSSVPLLGPRLSLFELALVVFPKMQKYEDDLRDQWQSRAHRASWARILRALSETDGSAGILALSGEIHLATQAEMPLGRGRRLLQLVASGVTHRPPPVGWARLLGSLARWGQTPLPAHPITFHPLPGQRGLYTAERNTLWLTRQAGAWTAQWDLEMSGMTPPQELGLATSAGRPASRAGAAAPSAASA